jgi:hypothetical protein
MRFDNASLQEAKRLGYVVVSYTAASGDYGDAVEPKTVVEKTLRNTDDGGILLLHDYPATAAALSEILESLSSQGYKFVTVSEMIAHLPAKEREPALSALNANLEEGQLKRPVFLPPSVPTAASAELPRDAIHAHKAKRGSKG